MADGLRTHVALPEERIHSFCQKWGVQEFALFEPGLRDDFDAEADLSRAAFEVNEMAQSAVIREIQVIGEAARVVLAETKTKRAQFA